MAERVQTTVQEQSDARARRQLYLDANDELNEQDSLEPDEFGQLPKLNVRTENLFNPANNLQPVDFDETGQVIPRPATIQEPSGELTSPATDFLIEQDRAVRPQVSLGTAETLTPEGPVGMGLRAIAATGLGKDFIEKAADLTEDIKVQITAGALDAANETLTGINAVFNGGSDTVLMELANKIPEIEKTDVAAANFARSVSQFSTIFVPGLKASQAVLKGQKLLKTAGSVNVAADAAASGIADFFAFEGNRPGGLHSLIKEHAPTLTETPYFGTLMEYLEADPGDSEAEGRWKNFLDGQMTNAVFQTVSNGRQVVKGLADVVEGVRHSNHLRKILGNERGAIGGGGRQTLSLPGKTGQPVNPDRLEELERARAIETPRERFMAKKTALRAAGNGSAENVKLMTKKFDVDIEELRNVDLSDAANVETLAAIKSVQIDLGKSIQDAGKEYVAKGLGSVEQDKLFLARLNDLADADAAWEGAISTMGSALQSTHTLGGIGRAEGLTDVQQLMRRMKSSTPEERFELAKLIHAKKPVEQLAALKQVSKFGKVYGNMRKAFIDTFIASRFSVPSVTTNVVGNTAQVVAMNSTRLGAALVSSLGKAPVVGKHLDIGSNITFTESYYLSLGTVEGIKAGVKASIDNFIDPTKVYKGTEKNNILEMSVDDLGKPAPGGDYSSAIGQKLGQGAHVIISALPRIMGAMDQGFKHIIRHGNRRALAYRKAVETVNDLERTNLLQGESRANALNRVNKEVLADLPDDIIRGADKAAEVNTYTDDFVKRKEGQLDGQIEDWLSSTQDMLNANPMSKMLITFFRTPVRMAQQGAKFTPGLGALVQDGEEQLLKGIADGDRRALKIGKQMVGGAVGAMGWAAHESGWFVGNTVYTHHDENGKETKHVLGPKGRKGNAILNLKGVQPMSIVLKKDKFGNPTKTLPIGEMLGPLSVPMRLMVSGQETIQRFWDHYQEEEGDIDPDEQRDYDNYFSAWMSSMGTAAQDQAFFSNFTELLSNIAAGRDSAVESAIARMASVPLVEKFAKTFGDEVKATDGLWGKIKDKWTWSSETTPVKVDVFGRAHIPGRGVAGQYLQPGLMPAMARNLLPVATHADYTGEAGEALTNFIGTYGEDLAGLTEVKMIGGVKLNAEQRSAFMRIRGGEPAVLKNGTRLAPVRVKGSTFQGFVADLAGKTLHQDPAKDRIVKVASYNSMLGAYGQMAQIELLEQFPDLKKQIDDYRLTSKGVVAAQAAGGSR